MRHHVTIGLIACSVAGWSALGIKAQDAPQPAESDSSAATTAERHLPEDLMTPTKHGFRLTPEMSKLMAKRWLQVEIGKDVTLSNEQQSQLADRVGERFDDIVKNHGPELRELIEYSVESLLDAKGKPLDKEHGEEFAQRAKDLLPVMRDFFKDFARDARPLLADDQWAQLKDRLRRDFKRVDRVDEIMQRWANGGGQEDEDLFAEIGKADEDGLTPQGKQDRKVQADLRRARRRADRDMEKLSPRRWDAFLQSTAEFFSFDQQQREKGQAVLTEYVAQAEQIMNPAWRERCRQNRVKYGMRWTVGKEATSPWVFHLESEYSEMMAPLIELESKFHEEVRALATPGQKEAAADKLRQRAAEHGMSWSDMDAQALGLGR